MAADAAPARIGTRPGVVIARTMIGEPGDPGEPQAPAVLLLHGFASSAEQNWMRAGWPAALAKAGLGGIALDLPGHGASSKPSEPAAYALDLLVGDVLALLDDGGVGSVHVLGYSFGARLGWELGVRHPERVGDLVLGGLPAREPLSAFRVDEATRYAVSGEPVSDPFTAGFVSMAEAVPGTDLIALCAFVTAQQATPALGDGGPRPAAPMLLVRGELDEIADDTAALLAPGTEFLELPGRSHGNAITARAFKESAVAFFGRHPG